MDLKKLLKKAHDLMYKNLEENMNLANEFGDSSMNKEQYKEALIIYEKILEIDPKNKEALDGKENAAIMLESFYPQQSMAHPNFDSLETRKKISEPKTPWEKKRGVIHQQKTGLEYTAGVVRKNHDQFINNCENLLIEAATYTKTHSTEETFKLFSEKINSQVPISKIAYVGTDFDPTDFLERLKKMLKVIDK